MNPERLGPEMAPPIETVTAPEVDRPDAPRIYVASLSDYNAGRLFGTWIEADQDYQEISEQVTEMLSRSREDVAEEWAIHDYEGFGPLHLSEYESLETVARLGRGIAEHGEAFAGWAVQLDRAEWDRLDRFEDSYLGHWSSAEDYAENLLEDIGIDLDEIGPEMLQPYIRVDLEAFARDLSYDLTIVEAQDGGVHVFDRE